MTSVVLGSVLVTGCSTMSLSRRGAPSEGLLLHYSFDKDGTTNVHDDSGRGNHGTVRGAKYSPEGKVGGAYEVGRAIGCIEVAPNSVWSFGTNDFSVAFWFKAQREMDNREHFFIGCDEGGGNKNKWGLELGWGSLIFHINTADGGGQRIASQPWKPDIDQWYHLAVTRNASKYSIYVDGNMVSMQHNQTAIPPVQAPLTIGHAENLYVEGMMDEVMIYGRALSAAEVARIHSAAR